MVAFSAEVTDCRLQGAKTVLWKTVLWKCMATAAGCRRSGVCHIHSPVAAVGKITWVLCAWAAIGDLQRSAANSQMQGSWAAGLQPWDVARSSISDNLRVGCSLMSLNRVQGQVLQADLALCAAGPAMHGSTNSNAPMGHMGLAAPLASRLSYNQQNGT